jgi:alkylmercury lyase
MPQLDLAAIAHALADSLPESHCDRDFCLLLLRLLADGQPVALAHVAAALNRSLGDVVGALRQLSNVEVDHEGHIIAAVGLSLTPTPHRFQVGDQTLFTWCALDTLMYPTLLQRPAQVTSRCPATGAMIRVTVTPKTVVDLDPPEAVVSLVIPETAAACCDIRGAFCNDVHFFASSEAAAAWLADHPTALILPVADGYTLGIMAIRELYPDMLATEVGNPDAAGAWNRRVYERER